MSEINQGLNIRSNFSHLLLALAVKAYVTFIKCAESNSPSYSALGLPFWQHSPAVHVKYVGSYQN